jgi:hypothetical protein
MSKSDKSCREIVSRIYDLLDHPRCYDAILHYIEGLEEAFKTEINQQSDFPIISGNVIPFKLRSYHEHFRSDRIQEFLKYLSDYPDLADHFCDLLFLKYLPQCKRLKQACLKG